MFWFIITTFVLSLKAVYEYENQIALVKNKLQSLVITNGDSIAQKVWNIDDKQISIQLQGFLNVPEIVYIGIKSDTHSWEEGINSIEQKLVYEAPILYKYKGKTENLGLITLIADKQIIIDNLIYQLIEALLFFGLLSLLLVVSIFLIFYQLITKHLDKLAQYTSSLSFEKDITPLELERPKNNPKHPDELDHVVTAINTMDSKVHELRSSLEQKNMMLLQQSKMAAMGEMLENIAHQWKQPLSVITTSASGARLQKEMGVLDDEELDKLLDYITDSTQYLAQTIDDFRSFFKQDKQKHNFNLITAFERAEFLLSSKFKNRDIHLVKEVIELEIYGYENELIQVFMNILNNAKDVLLEQDLEKKLIVVNSFKTNDSVVIEITDNGGGIKEENLPKVFDARFTTKGDQDGTGIGLYMSSSIMEKSNGSLNVENATFTFEEQEYTGAKFIIKLPL